MPTTRHILVSSILAAAWLQGLMLLSVATAQEPSNHGEWTLLANRRPITISFQEKSLQDVLTEITRQSHVSIPVSLRGALANKNLRVSMRDASFWQAIACVAQLADAEMAVEGVNGKYRLAFETNSVRASKDRQYGFSGPFCLELSRLGAAVTPDDIKETWRLRIHGLPEDGDTRDLKVSACDVQTRKEQDCQLIPISDHRGDIVRATRGTYDHFFRLPEAIESHGFSCKVRLSVNELVAWKWIAVALKEDAEVHEGDVRFRISQVSKQGKDIRASYSMSWSPGLCEDSINKRESLFEKLLNGQKLTEKEVQWMRAPKNQIKAMSIREFSVDGSGQVSLSQESSRRLAEPKVFGQVSVAAPSESWPVLRLQIAEMRLREETCVLSCGPAVTAR